MARTKQSLQLGKPVKLKFSDRYYQFNRQYAVRDVFDALVELVTNCDDSYHRLYERGQIEKDGGSILIECMEQRKGIPSLLRVRDRAEGMTLDEMMSNLRKVGSRTSDKGDRGFMARGARDCTELGEMLFESIKDDRYHACQLKPKPELVPISNGDRLSSSLREKLGIKRGNGTVVTLSLDPGHKMPRFATLVRDLPRHFALRDIFSEKSSSRVQLLNLKDLSSFHIVFQSPVGEVLIDDLEYLILGYPQAVARLTIAKTSEPFDATGDRRFRNSGFIVKGKRAINECSLLRPEFESNPYTARYFGRIECNYIDELLDEYDEHRRKGRPFPDHNPRLLIDPNRQVGLIREHPFTQALFQFPSERLRAFITKDREAERTQHRQIANKETQQRLSRLAKAASQFMKLQLDDATEYISGGETDPSAFTERGLMVVPTYARLKVGEEKKFWVYVKRDLVSSERLVSSVDKDSDAITVLDPVIELLPHVSKEDRLVGTFRIHAEAISDAICLQVINESLPTAEAIVEIVESIVENRDFQDPLEFEHSAYSIRLGSTRTISLFALFPDLVSEETPITVKSMDSTIAAIRSAVHLSPIANSNFARGNVLVQGRRLNGRTTILASVNGREASAAVRVVEKEREGIPIKIILQDEDFNNFRAIWADHEGHPNHLLVSARHTSISRYLGPSPDFEGQNTPIFRLLLAELVAESVCRKVMELDAKNHPWDFRLADIKDDHVIINTVLARLHAAIRDFVADAHSIMLQDTEFQ